MRLNAPLQLIPEFREYVWGGQRLRPGQVTAEAWVLYEGNRIAGGEAAGLTLAQLVEQYGAALLGHAGAQRAGGRFPLLVKLLDCAQWLSLQVHPNDAQAVELEGAGQNGKTEAWHILQAGEGAQIIAGMRAGGRAFPAGGGGGGTRRGEAGGGERGAAGAGGARGKHPGGGAVPDGEGRGYGDDACRDDPRAGAGLAGL